MLISEPGNHIDRIWDGFWYGGISNPLDGIEHQGHGGCRVKASWTGRWLTPLVSLWLAGCAGGPRVPVENTDYGLRDGFVWVRGPWEAVTPSTDVDEVIDQLCPAVMQLPRAQGGDYGLEWCGAIYSLEDSK